MVEMPPIEEVIALAERYADMGISTVICGGDTGKKPLVDWKELQHRLPTEDDFREWRRYEKGNLGLITGAFSEITVVDIDQPISDEEITQLFGETPYTVVTPRGGRHAYYKYHQERNGTDVAQHLGIKADLRGEGGIVIVPPSVNPQTGNHYTSQGGLEDLQSLPEMKPLKVLTGEDLYHIQEGTRNAALFDYARRIGKECKTQKTLHRRVWAYNLEMCAPPLTATECAGIVKSVWKYRISGNLISGSTQYAMMALEEIRELSPNAFQLLAFLKASHEGLRSTFAIACTSKILGFGPKRISAAVDELCKKSYLKCVRKPQKHQAGAYSFIF